MLTLIRNINILDADRERKKRIYEKLIIKEKTC